MDADWAQVGGWAGQERLARYEAALREVGSCLRADPAGSCEMVVHCERIIRHVIGVEADRSMPGAVSEMTLGAAPSHTEQVEWERRYCRP
jgi:hypothetical protein